MAKMTFVQQSIDKELAAKGKKRTMVPFSFLRPDGEMVTCYKEKIVNVEASSNVVTVSDITGKAPKKPMPKKVARKGTNLERVVEFVKTSDLKGKPELVKGIVEMLNVTEANAKVYLYKAVQLI